MLKKVSLENIHTGRKTTLVVDTDTDEKAIAGAGKAANETAKVTNLGGLDESITRITGKGGSLSDRAALFGGVARCLERNISTIKSFELQANRVKSARYRGIIAEVSHQISIGEKISDAMEKFPDAFGAEIIALIRAGEESGRLPEVFKQIGESQKKTVAIIKKLKKGMIYPGIVTFLGFAVVIVMAYTLVPAVSKLYKDLGATLPLATRVMMKLSEILISSPWVLLFPCIFFYVLFKNWGRLMKKRAVQKVFIHTPSIGGIVRMSSASVSFRCLALLLESGVRISTALQITSESAPHFYYKNFFANIKEHINDGLSMQESFLMEAHWLGKDGRTITGIMDIAGETGSATEMLDEIANDYEDELDSIANQIDKVMEPVTILFLGALVGFLVYAIYSPIFGLSEVMLGDGKDKKPPKTARP
jgi:type II secretory pathway component PulF